MKLGIIVVYMVKEENEPILTFHLKTIEQYTTVPYTIYGSVNRLLPAFRKQLINHPRIKTFELPYPKFRGKGEHSYYLEQLIQHALQDGVSHIVTLHVDSFPVKPGWAEQLAGELSDSCVLVTIARKNFLLQYTACLFFHREFYLTYKPTFHLSEKELSSPQYQQFCREVPHHAGDSGFGYVFKAYSQGLSWKTLRKTSLEVDAHSLSTMYHDFGCIYGDLIFHFEGSFRRPESLGKKWVLVKLNLPPFFHRLNEILNPMLPKKISNYIRKRLVRGANASYVRREFLKDPESYLNYLRTGKKT
jgi:hypothetical protein